MRISVAFADSYSEMEPTIATPAEAGSKDKKRIPLIWIPVTIGIGLLIAALYLGARIVTAHRSEQAAARAIPVPPPQPASVAVTQPVVIAAPAELRPEIKAERSAPVISDDALAVPIITPHGGERYIQVGALNLRATRRFVADLRDRKLEPLVAPGPTPEIMRVLIGPFDDSEALNQRKAQLQTEGLDTFVREY
jgi:cell division septation protein DedD